jgi:hypothetical protein
MANSFFMTPSGVKQPAFSDLTGSPTQAQGIASLINGSAVNLTGQNATITTTTLFSVGSSGAGVYRVAFSLIDTSSGSAGTVTATIGWNNGTGAQSSTTASLSLSSAGGEVSGDFIFTSAASQNITYATTVTGVLGSPFYTLKLRIEYLG